MTGSGCSQPCSFYDENLKAHVMTDIVINDKGDLTALTPVEVEFKGPVKAIIVNHHDHGYAKIRYDEKTLATLTSEMYKIDDYLTRAVCWRQFWIMVNDGLMSPIQYLDLVCSQLPKETIEQAINVVLGHSKLCIDRFIPVEKTKEYNAKLL